ncbi:unnamed protein product, partial [marine sediment metagenome]
GTPNLIQQPVMLASYDYCLIGDEIYAASSVISKEPIKLGSIAGEDIGKYISL